ncbi:MAG: M23 family peptidase, partial [Lacisediminimonas sp.]|nr:M23 family peptidase [Lacisediminimonas sp.]
MRILIALLLCIALPAQAAGYLTRLLNHPVPGGVAVVDLGAAASAPSASFQGKPVLVIHEDQSRWIAIVGLPLTLKPGTQQISSQNAEGTHKLSFTVGSKHYAEQRITLKNTQMVNPDTSNL